MESVSWWDYVQRITQNEQGNAVARKVGVDPSTITRWKTATGKPEHVAAFARAYGRPVLEAFIAAGFLTAKEAGEVPTAPPSAADLDDNELIDQLRLRLAHTREEQGHARSAAAISRAGGSPAPGAVEDLDRRRRKHPRHPAYGPDHFNDDEATPPSRGDLSPEARPDLYVDEAAQHREHTAREDNTDDGG